MIKNGPSSETCKTHKGGTWATSDEEYVEEKRHRFDNVLVPTDAGRLKGQLLSQLQQHLHKHPPAVRAVSEAVVNGATQASHDMLWIQPLITCALLFAAASCR